MRHPGGIEAVIENQKMYRRNEIERVWREIRGLPDDHEMDMSDDLWELADRLLMTDPTDVKSGPTEHIALPDVLPPAYTQLASAVLPFYMAACKGKKVYDAAAELREAKPELFSLSAPMAPMAVDHAQSQVSWRDWDDLRKAVGELTPASGQQRVALIEPDTVKFNMDENDRMWVFVGPWSLLIDRHLTDGDRDLGPGVTVKLFAKGCEGDEDAYFEMFHDWDHHAESVAEEEG